MLDITEMKKLLKASLPHKRFKHSFFYWCNFPSFSLSFIYTDAKIPAALFPRPQSDRETLRQTQSHAAQSIKAQRRCALEGIGQTPGYHLTSGVSELLRVLRIRQHVKRKCSRRKML